MKKEIVLSADTSRPKTSTFIPGEKVTLRFRIKGVTSLDKDLKLLVDIVDEHHKSIEKKEIAVVPESNGTAKISLVAPNRKLGFYRVYAKLSNGVTLPKLGSRPAGYLTYAVVPDPARRRLFPEKETRFGMQGGFSPKVNILPYLGVRWVLGGFSWRQLEPNHAGEFVEKIAQAKKEGKIYPPRPITTQYTFEGKPWKVYTLPSLFMINSMKNQWPVIPQTLGPNRLTGALTPEGEKAWSNFCREVGRVYPEEYPDREEDIYQITWEPVYPWGFKGTDEQLIRIYEIAYKALHEVDPKAVIVGPTGGGISGSSNLDWNITLLKKGLGKYLDGFSIHPYFTIPPEKGLIKNIRSLKAAIHQYTGKNLPLFGTEQGYATKGNPAKELSRARALIRANLIMLGEGYRFNFAFYIADYSSAGYGYYYNLNPKTSFGTDKISPKPIAPAYAAQSFLLDGYTSAGAIEWLGGSAWGYVFERPENIILALWNYGDKPRQVSIPVGVKKVEVYDWMGNGKSVFSKNGSIDLKLSQEPVYVSGVSGKIWGRSAKKKLCLTTKRISSYPGGSVLVSGEVKASSGKSISGVIIVEAGSFSGIKKAEKRISLAGGEKDTFNLALAIPADIPLGSYPVKVILRDKAGLISVDGLRLNIIPPVGIESVRPVFPAGRQRGLKIALKEVQGERFQGKVQVAIEGVPESREVAKISLLPNSEQPLVVNYKALEVLPARTYQATITITTDKGYKFAENFPVNFMKASRFSQPPVIDGRLSDWKQVPAISLEGKSWVVRSPEFYSGPGDLRARIRYAWDKKYLYLGFEVWDDVFVQQYTGFMTWKGDSLQLAFNLDPGKTVEKTGNILANMGSGPRYSEIDLALTKKGPQAYRTISFDRKKFPVGLIPSAKLKLAVLKTGGKRNVRLIYEAAIPWKTLGSLKAPRPGDIIGIAATVNDMDSPKQRDPSALGIFTLKNPAKFGMLVLGAE